MATTTSSPIFETTTTISPSEEGDDIITPPMPEEPIEGDFKGLYITIIILSIVFFLLFVGFLYKTIKGAPSSLSS